MQLLLPSPFWFSRVRKSFFIMWTSWQVKGWRTYPRLSPQKDGHEFSARSKSKALLNDQKSTRPLKVRTKTLRRSLPCNHLLTNQSKRESKKLRSLLRCKVGACCYVLIFCSEIVGICLNIYSSLTMKLILLVDCIGCQYNHFHLKLNYPQGFLIQELYTNWKLSNICTLISKPNFLNHRSSRLKSRSRPRLSLNAILATFLYWFTIELPPRSLKYSKSCFQSLSL